MNTKTVEETISNILFQLNNHFEFENSDYDFVQAIVTSEIKELIKSFHGQSAHGSEKIVEKFEELVGNFTFSNQGELELTLWDVVDERVHPTDEIGVVIQNWLRTTLTEVRNEAIKECEGCVPEKMKVQNVNLYRADDPSYDEGEEWNSCRNQTLQAIRQMYE